MARSNVSDDLLISMDVSARVRMKVPHDDKRASINRAEKALHSEFGEFARRLQDLGFDALFHINERPVRKEPDRRMAPVDIEQPYERRWDKREELEEERFLLRELDAKKPAEGNVDKEWIHRRLGDIEELLRARDAK